MDCSLTGFCVHGIFQARILEWAAISFSRRSSQPRDWTRVSHIVGRCFLQKRGAHSDFRGSVTPTAGVLWHPSGRKRPARWMDAHSPACHPALWGFTLWRLPQAVPGAPPLGKGAGDLGVWTLPFQSDPQHGTGWRVPSTPGHQVRDRHCRPPPAACCSPGLHTPSGI